MVQEIEMYLGQTLGVAVRVDVWGGGNRLPFFLQRAYEYLTLHLLGVDFLMMFDVDPQEVPPAKIKKHMEQVQKVWTGDVIYVRDQMTAYNRKRLIVNRVPFIVPGNQMYLPMLAIDLREHFFKKRVEVQTLSPAAQVLVLYSVYMQRALFSGAMTMKEWAEELGYTKMTMTRAFREIKSIVGNIEAEDKIEGHRLWEKVRPYLRSPVMRRHYCHVECDVPPAGGLFAGDSALAHYTMLAESECVTVCMNGKAWKAFQENLNPVALSRPEPDALTVEVWRYVPSCLSGGGLIADPLSVYLSFEQNRDERVEMAVENLLEVVKW